MAYKEEENKECEDMIYKINLKIGETLKTIEKNYH